MYLIVKHSFDSLENYDPEYTEVIGYIKDELGADSWIKSQDDKKQYTSVKIYHLVYENHDQV